MVLLILSAGFVGFVHSLAPGHWLPIVLMAKMHKWKLKSSIAGALVTSFAHVLISISLGAISVFIGFQFLSEHEPLVESYAGLGLGIFGLVYAGFAFFRHYRCHGHIHHGPKPDKKRAPFLFLFLLGLSPCVAVLPVFAAAASEGYVPALLTFLSFAIGVVCSLIGSTVVVSLGLVKLDHPIFEHYGDVITGLGMSILGFILFFISG